MRTVVLGPRPPQLDELIEHRRATGADRYDEVWEGEYHMAPAPSGPHAMVDSEVAGILRTRARSAGLVGMGAFNLGEPDNFRVPDHGLLRERLSRVWYPTAALVVEIVSPDDESWDKFDFYAARGVDEVVIVDPSDRSVHWFALAGSAYECVTSSTVLDIDVASVTAEIDWPPLDSASS